MSIKEISLINWKILCWSCFKSPLDCILCCQTGPHVGFTCSQFWFPAMRAKGPGWPMSPSIIEGYSLCRLCRELGNIWPPSQKFAIERFYFWEMTVRAWDKWSVENGNPDQHQNAEESFQSHSSKIFCGVLKHYSKRPEMLAQVTYHFIKGLALSALRIKRI